MLTLFSYPELFGVADNNPYGLKIFAFLKLCGLPFRHQHIFDASAAPRGQLPYIDDDGEIIGDSDRIIAHLIRRNGLTIDDALTAPQRDVDLMIRRLLDDLYWVMSYSRWRDDAYWPLFRDEILKTHPNVSAESLERAREYNFQRYYYPAASLRAATSCARACGRDGPPRLFRGRASRTASHNVRRSFISRNIPSRCIFFFSALRA